MVNPRNCAKRIVFLAAFASSVLAQSGRTQANRVTPVAGESWLTHLGRSFDETSMGKTGRLGPGELEPKDQGSGWALPLSGRADAQITVLHGADLYRLNCRGCHGEAGLGAPPEINSVINPVRAGSVTLILSRMKRSGLSMRRSEAAELAQQSQAALLQRLHLGGKDMPPFPHLNEAEIRALTAYLKQLADVPGAEAEQLAVSEPRMRVGEHIVKSTCHICHSASGKNPDAEQLAEGAIPPLSTLTSRVNPAQFVRKITRGAPIVMGATPLMCRGRMPVFYYLSEQEAVDAYLYLSSYRPYQWATLDPAVAPPARDPDPSDSDPPKLLATVSFAGESERGKAAAANDAAGGQVMSLMIVAGMLVTLLLAGGFLFTVRECMRLSAKGMDRKLAPVAVRIAGSDGTDGPEDDRLVA
jgi:cytochrome c